MATHREGLRSLTRLDEGVLKKGGVNERYQTLTRPPDPPPMKPPAEAAPPKRDSSPKK